MVAINPCTVLGPLLQPTWNSYSREKIPSKTCRCVDVRDVANAHIQAFENPSACGRYPEEKARAPNCRVSKERAQSLGITFISLEVSLKDTVESLKTKSFFNA